MRGEERVEEREEKRGEERREEKRKAVHVRTKARKETELIEHRKEIELS